MATREALVVDDSRSARFAMRKYLERYRYSVATAEDGAQALQYLETHRPLVVFLDYLMPGVSGLDVLRTLKSDPLRMGIPIVICSSVDKAEFRAQARESGATDILPKPPSLEQLERLLGALERDADRPPPLVIAKLAAAPVAEPVPTPAARAPQPVVAAAAESPPGAPAPVMTAAPVVDAAPQAEMSLVPESGERYVVLRGEIDHGLRRLTEDIFVQLAELKSQLVHLNQNGMSEADRNALREMAREEADSLNHAIRQELSLVRQRLDAIDQLQSRERHEVLQAARIVAAKEAHLVARHTVMGAAADLSHKLTDAISKALGRPGP